MNILAILTDESVIHEFELPHVNKILFLESLDLSGINIGGIIHSVGAAFELIWDKMNLNSIEMRKKRIHSMSDVSDLVSSAVHEVSPENIIIDLTSGRKDLTGSLYTAATISGIKNMVYIEVKKDDAGSFFDLSTDPYKIGKFSMKKFEGLSELQELASMNSIEFIEYKKLILNFQSQFDDPSPFVAECVQHMDNAINLYFLNKYGNCIHTIGLLNEQLVGKVASALKTCFPPVDNNNNSNEAYKTIREYQTKYEDLCKNRNRQSEEQKALFVLYDQFFHPVRGAFHLFSLIRSYRNAASHEGHNFSRDEAKLLIQTMIHILLASSQSIISDLLFTKTTDPEG